MLQHLRKTSIDLEGMGQAIGCVRFCQLVASEVVHMFVFGFQLEDERGGARRTPNKLGRMVHGIQTGKTCTGACVIAFKEVIFVVLPYTEA